MTKSIDVLLVDEDKETLALAETFLERKSDHIVVQTETDPSVAIERLVDGEFDCVVSDYRMPTMNGVELFETVHEHRDIPFFLFTGSKAEDIGLDVCEDTIGYVQKGVGTAHYDELVEGIESRCQ